jgi:hypothetical protein
MHAVQDGQRLGINDDRMPEDTGRQQIAGYRASAASYHLFVREKVADAPQNQRKL